MARRFTLTQVLAMEEPKRTSLLRKLEESGLAVRVLYKPTSAAPSHRRERYEVSYGIPPRPVVFEAGKPKSVAIGLAVMLLHNLRPGASRQKWRPGEWTEVDEGFDADTLPASDEEIAAAVASPLEPAADPSSKLADDPAGMLERDAKPEDDEPDVPAEVLRSRADDGKGLEAMKVAELRIVHDYEIGPTPSDATKAAIVDAIRSHRAAEATE